MHETVVAPQPFVAAPQPFVVAPQPIADADADAAYTYYEESSASTSASALTSASASTSAAYIYVKPTKIDPAYLNLRLQPKVFLSQTGKLLISIKVYNHPDFTVEVFITNAEYGYYARESKYLGLDGRFHNFP